MSRERRITELLLGYWNIIKGNRLFPKYDDVNSHDISDIWDNCFIVHITNSSEKNKYNYLYLGTNLEQAYNGDSLTIDDAPPLASPMVDRLVNKYEEVLRSRAPIIEEDAFVNARGKTVRYRQILLPLGPNDSEVSHILGGMRYKLYE